MGQPEGQIKYQDRFSRLDTIPWCDGQTYRHLTTAKTAQCRASRG